MDREDQAELEWKKLLLREARWREANAIRSEAKIIRTARQLREVRWERERLKTDNMELAPLPTAIRDAPHEVDNGTTIRNQSAFESFWEKANDTRSRPNRIPVVEGCSDTEYGQGLDQSMPVSNRSIFLALLLFPITVLRLISESCKTVNIRINRFLQAHTGEISQVYFVAGFILFIFALAVIESAGGGPAKNGKAVPVRGYERADGTSVDSYLRSLPNR